MADKRDITIKRRAAAKPKSNPSPTEEKQSASPAKRKRKKKNILRLALRMLLVVAALALVVVLIYNWKSLAPEAMVEWIETVFTGRGNGDGFPLSIDGESVLDMTQVKRQTALLAEHSLVFLSDSAGEFRRCSYSFTNPIMSTADKYVLLLDRGGTQYQLETRFETVCAGALSGGSILTGCIDEEGTFAVAMQASSQDYLSTVVLMDRTGKQIFLWKSPKWMVTDVALRDGRLAVSGICASEGALSSAVILFDYLNDPNNPVIRQQGDTMFSRIFLSEQQTVSVVTDQAVQCYDFNGNLRGRFDFGGLEWTAAAQCGDMLGIVLSSSGFPDGGYVVVLDDSASPTLRTDFQGAFRSLKSKVDGFWLLTDLSVYPVTKTALQQGIAVPADSRLACDFNGSPLVLGLSELQHYLQGDDDQ